MCVYASACICVCMCFISNYLILHFENDFTKFVVLLQYFDGTKCEKFFAFLIIVEFLKIYVMRKIQAHRKIAKATKPFSI